MFGGMFAKPEYSNIKIINLTPVEILCIMANIVTFAAVAL
jgi:hypothetical protein